MNVVGYLRVSTDRQAEEGLGLEVQEAAIQEWAARNEHRVLKVCRDEGISGSNGLETRVGLAEALELLGNRSAGALVVLAGAQVQGASRISMGREVGGTPRRSSRVAFAGTPC